MKTPRASSRKFAIQAGYWLFLLVGCGYSPPGLPEHFPTTTVTGKVTFAGQPVGEKGQAWITFWPEDFAVGDAVTQPIGRDGRFQNSNVPIGPLSVRLELSAAAMEKIPAASRPRIRAFKGPASPIHLVSKANVVKTFDIDLAQMRFPGE